MRALDSWQAKGITSARDLGIEISDGSGTTMPNASSTVAAVDCENDERGKMRTARSQSLHGDLILKKGRILRIRKLGLYVARSREDCA